MLSSTTKLSLIKGLISELKSIGLIGLTGYKGRDLS